jgi:hypothetical protein
VAGLLAVVLALGGCGSAASPGPGGSPSADASPSAAPLPEASFTGGTASARLTQPAKVAWDGGWCERGAGDAWLALSIGYPNGEEYFGLVVGQSPYTPAATRGAAGGGTFGGDDVVLTWRHAGTAANVVPGGLVLELAKDLSLGTFSGRLADGTEVAGTFAC